MADFKASTAMVRGSFVLWQLRSSADWDSIDVHEADRRAQEYGDAFDKWLESERG